ncbi:MAG: 3-isopropylmalate dehydratase large subunit [Myxococcota bacterium]|nr:3-isopropylmalate dehydratase large subunit [Myxococcota bacterium]
MKLTGKILYLTDDPALIQRQLEPGAPQFRYRGEPLAFGVNTDAMISGQACTLGYTGEILGPHFLRNFKGVVDLEAIRKGGFEVIVGGDAYGTGSSREVAVVAHQGAGIKLVAAKSFQRIFQENMVYGGMPFTTDLSVLDRLLAGEDVDLSAFTRELPPFFRAVSQSGGLLPYANRLISGEARPPESARAARRPLNITEKIVARNALAGSLPENAFGLDSVRPGDQVLARTDFRGVHEYTGGMVVALYEEAFGKAPVSNPSSVAAFEDHFVLLDHGAVPEDVRASRLKPAMDLTKEMLEGCARMGVKVHGPHRDLPPGVCHRLVVERYALPGTINVLTDSHTPTAGVLNCLAFGVGSTAMAFAMRTGLIPVTVPKTVRINVTGRAGSVVSPKDLILHIIGDPYFREEHWRESPTDTCVIELGGPGLEQWNVDELSVLTNMTVEGGLMTGVVEPCAPIISFLKTQRGLSEERLAPLLVRPDPGAEYARVWNLDLGEVPVTVASPGDSRNRVALDKAGDTPVHNVVIASCTGGSLADLRAAFQVLRGRKMAPTVRMTVTPSSHDVAMAAEKEGILEFFRTLGAVVTEPGCGSCIGNGPGIPRPGEITASTTNRNFDRRMGAPGDVWLVSPAVAAASAITGRLTDPRSLD